MKQGINGNKLLHCPFCGQTESLQVDKYSLIHDCDDDDNEGWGVVCSALQGGCGVSSGYRVSIQQAIMLWNSRTRSEEYNDIRHTNNK